jgi:hypothetical protein
LSTKIQIAHAAVSTETAHQSFQLDSHGTKAGQNIQQFVLQLRASGIGQQLKAQKQSSHKNIIRARRQTFIQDRPPGGEAQGRKENFMMKSCSTIQNAPEKYKNPMSY